MQNKPILVLKQSASGIQQLQHVGSGERPSFKNLMRTVAAPKGKVRLRDRIGAAFGLGLKGTAGVKTALETAHRMQGGDPLAALQAGQTYEANDPTRFLSGTTNAVQQKDARRAQRLDTERETMRQQRATERAHAQREKETMQNLSPPMREKMGLPPPPAQRGPPPRIGPSPRLSRPVNVRIPSPDERPPRPDFMNYPTSSTALPPLPPHIQAGREMSGNQPKQPGPMMPTHTPPAGVPDSRIVNTGMEFNAATQSSTDPIANLSQMYPPVPTDPYANYQQQQLPRGGPLNALPPVPGAKPQGPPPAHTSTMHPMAAQQSMVGVLPPMNQSPSAHSTANPLSQSDINYANEVLAQYHNQLPQQQQASMNTYGSSAVSPQQAQGNFNTQQWGQPDPNQSLGSSVNWNQWNQDMPEWMKKSMLKAFISYLYDNMGSYLYKMTPHEAGTFAVDVFFKMRE